MVNILIVEDEKLISNLIKTTLKDAGYSCFTAFDGEEAIEKIDEICFDLILLDVMLPKISGFEILQYIKPLDIPVIMITAKDELEDKVKGLKEGADDYITKPFELVELLARVEALLRRLSKLDNKINFLDIEIDLISRQVTKNNEIVTLTTKEFDLLLLLAKNKNIALFRDRILEKVWGYDFDCDSKTLDLHISRLRQKLSLTQNIKAIKKIGFRLEV